MTSTKGKRRASAKPRVDNPPSIEPKYERYIIGVTRTVMTRAVISVLAESEEIACQKAIRNAKERDEWRSVDELPDYTTEIVTSSVKK